VSFERRYWDSDCFLGWLQAEPDKEEECGQVLQAAEEGKVLIVTSALTIAEVLNLRGHPKLPTASREQTKAFFRNDYILVRNITRRVAEAARDYVWDHGIKPKDALHVATALDAGLSLFNTFDGELIAKSGRLEAVVTIRVPSGLQPGRGMRPGAGTGR
jgi:predicted nucleic acid-binding protein